MPTYNFPNGQSLVSSALTPDQVQGIFQDVIAQILGFNITSQANQAYAAVRVDWPTGSQPAWGITEDVCFVAATTENEPFARWRDELYNPNDSESLTQDMAFTQVWRVRLLFYGPNAADHAQLVLSALTFPWVRDILTAANLYMVAGPDRPTYAPELFGSQWWKRSDITGLLFNELATQSTTVSSAAGVDVTIETDTGDTEEIHIGD